MSKYQRDKGARFEREMATRLGVRRVVRGDYSTSCEDIEHPVFSIECKVRAGIAALRWLDQASTYGKRTGKVPVVFLREDRGAPAVLMWFDDWQELYRRGNV